MPPAPPPQMTPSSHTHGQSLSIRIPDLLCHLHRMLAGRQHRRGKCAGSGTTFGTAHRLSSWSETALSSGSAHHRPSAQACAGSGRPGCQPGTYEPSVLSGLHRRPERLHASAPCGSLHGFGLTFAYLGHCPAYHHLFAQPVDIAQHGLQFFGTEWIYVVLFPGVSPAGEGASRVLFFGCIVERGCRQL